MIEIIPNWHPVFVHFTVALLMLSFGLFVVAVVARCEQALLVAKWNLWIGAAVTLLTLAAGFYAYNSVAHDTPSHAAMTEHKNLALITAVLLLPVVVWSVVFHRRETKPGATFIGLFLVAAGSLTTTAWHGGELVYRFGLGVISMPNIDSHDHAAHDHGEPSQESEHPHSIEAEMDFSGLEFDDEVSVEADGPAEQHDHDGHDHTH